MLPGFDTIKDTPKKDKRLRYQWRFWLDANKDDELLMCEELDYLKSKRQFAPTIRNALRLFFDLSQGRIDVLRELFPGIVAQLQIPPDTPATTEFAQIIKQQAQLIEIMATQTTAPATMRQLPAPTTDNDTELITIQKDTSIDSGQNLLNGLLAFAGGTKEEATETRANFAGSLGNLFDDNEDIWD